MLELRNIQKSYEGKPLLRGVSLRVEPGETLCLLGPSGSGKSTLLRIIAGLEQPEAGEVLWNGKSILGTPAHRRGFGLMFQDYALFPHRDVAENVAFGLRMLGLPEEEIRRGVRDALEMVNLSGFDRRRVDDLSGGEQQRVALARTLAPHPVLLMFDEPVGALDRALREELLAELRRLLRRLGVPAIYVTHDQEEAFSLGDRAALLHDGRIEQSGPPAEIIARPASAWVAKFLALGNLIPARVVRAAPLKVETPLGDFPAVAGGGRPRVADEGYLLLRPDGGRIRRTRSRLPSSIRGTVADVTLRGSVYRVVLQSKDMEIVFHAMETVPPGRAATWSPARGLFLHE